MALIVHRLSIAGYTNGGIPVIQETLDFCAEAQHPPGDRTDRRRLHQHGLRGPAEDAMKAAHGDTATGTRTRSTS
ncbi:hypothetical protein ACWD00_28980 [Streptomyces viridiviolaceus]